VQQLPMRSQVLLLYRYEHENALLKQLFNTAEDIKKKYLKVQALLKAKLKEKEKWSKKPVVSSNKFIKSNTIIVPAADTSDSAPQVPTYSQILQKTSPASNKPPLPNIKVSDNSPTLNSKYVEKASEIPPETLSSNLSVAYHDELPPKIDANNSTNTPTVVFPPTLKSEVFSPVAAPVKISPKTKNVISKSIVLPSTSSNSASLFSSKPSSSKDVSPNFPSDQVTSNKSPVIPFPRCPSAQEIDDKTSKLVKDLREASTHYLASKSNKPVRSSSSSDSPKKKQNSSVVFPLSSKTDYAPLVWESRWLKLKKEGCNLDAISSGPKLKSGAPREGPRSSAKTLYVVWRGDSPGIYDSLEACHAHTKGLSKPNYRKIETGAENAFVALVDRVLGPNS
jgi:hypothetical protein